MANIDIKKYSENGMEFYKALDGAHDVIIAKLTYTKYFNSKCDGWAGSFGKLVRRLAVDLLKDRSHTKPALCKQYNVPARSYNLADSFAKAMVNSANELHKLHRETTDANLEKAIRSYVGGINREEDPKKLRQRMRRVHICDTKVDVFPDKPSIFIGGQKYYYNQHLDKDWKEKYAASRQDSFGARGSKDETCGNSTYQIQFVKQLVEETKVLGKLVPYNQYEFRVTSRQKKLGTFRLNEKEGNKLRDCLINNTALKVFFKRRDNGSWYIYMGYAITETPKSRVFNGVLGIDLNNGHLEASAVNTKLEVVQYWKEAYDSKCDKNTRERQLYAIIRRFVGYAKANNYKISLEYLEFEHSKKYLQNKLGAMLHVLPYRKIRKKFERECYKSGVELVYVKSEYTSVLGNLIASLDCKYSRDTAASIVIAMRALEGGNAYLNKICSNLKRLRLNAKGMFGRHIDIGEGLGAGKIDTARSVYALQYEIGRSIKKTMDMLTGVYYNDKQLGRMRTRWKATFNGCQIKSIEVGCRSPDDKTSESTSKRLVKLNTYFAESLKDSHNAQL